MTNVTLAQLKESLKKQKDDLLEEHFKRQEELLKIQKDELLQVFTHQQEVLKNELLLQFSKEHEKWNEELSAVKKIGEENASEILRLKGTIESLVSINKQQTDNVSKLTERLEDRTNRQLRSTLVFKGIPESPDERKGQKGAWDATRAVLSETLSKHIPSLSPEAGSSMFERIHRGKANKFSANKRKIYARAFDWNMTEKIKRDLRQANINDKSLNLYCDQMYGPRTTFRRNLALERRRNLKKDKKIVSGFVGYPAKLFVKYTNNRDEKYSMLEDFSDEAVVNFDSKTDDDSGDM